MGVQVLGATYPWIARRLLTDTSPELQVHPLSAPLPDDARIDSVFLNLVVAWLHQ